MAWLLMSERKCRLAVDDVQWSSHPIFNVSLYEPGDKTLPTKVIHVADSLHALTIRRGAVGVMVWTNECNDAFFDLKKHLITSNFPMLT